MIQSTFLVYLDGINQFYKKKSNDVDIRRDAIFNSAQGYMTVVNSIVKIEQEDGVHRKPTNVIIDEEISHMLRHDMTTPWNPKGYVTGLIVVAGFLTGLRTSELSILSSFSFCFACLIIVGVLANMPEK